MACGTMLPTLVLRGALEMLWRGVAIPPFHSIFISFLSFHFLPLLSTSFHAPVPVPVAVFSFSFSFPFCSCPFRFVPALSFFCALFSRPFFFLPLLLSCPFLSLCVSSFFPCWTVVAKFGRLPEPPATGFSPSLLPTSLSAAGWSYRYPPSHSPAQAPVCTTQQNPHPAHTHRPIRWPLGSLGKGGHTGCQREKPGVGPYGTRPQAP